MSFIDVLAQLSNEELIGSARWTGGGSLGLITVTLVLLLGIVLVVVYLNRRGGGMRHKQIQNLRVIETWPLGGRQFLLVVAYGEERFLLSVCPGRVEYLCLLPVIEESETPVPGVGAGARSGVFGQLLDHLSSDAKKKGEPCDN